MTKTVPATKLDSLAKARKARWAGHKKATKKKAHKQPAKTAVTLSAPGERLIVSRTRKPSLYEVAKALRILERAKLI